MSASPPADGGSHFDVLLLGSFTLFRDAIPVDSGGWQRKVQSLFRILATSPEKRRSRDELVEMLWPETDPENGSRNLRVVLHMLRRGLGTAEPPTILSEWGWIALNPAHEWDVDLDRFEELANACGEEVAELEEAAGHYRGEPLAEDRYDDWAIGVRVRAQRTWRELCLRLAKLHRQMGAPEIAVSWLDRVMESDTLDEEALLQLLLTLGDMGRRTEALRRYQSFAQRLKEELDLSPGRETMDVVAGLRAPELPSNSGTVFPETGIRPVPVIPRYSLAANGTLVGRQQELGRVLWTLPPMHVVAPRLVILSGETGMGKTRLLAEVAARARRAGLLTLAGSCYQYEGRIPYGPIRDALADYVEIQPENIVRTQFQGLLGILSRIVPEIRLRFPDILAEPQSSEVGPLLLFLAATKALERIAQDTPTVLLLDDLQWADEGTLRMLHFVVRHTSQNRALIVGTYGYHQNHEDPPPVAVMASDMEQAGWARCLALGPLAPNDLALLVEEYFRGHCSSGLIDALHEQSAGNPLIALQTVRRWQDAGRLRQADGAWQLIASAVLEPPELGEVLA